MPEINLTEMSPINLPVPSDRLKQVHRMAYDLAWGAIYGLWDVWFPNKSIQLADGSMRRDWGSETLTRYIDEIWGNDGLSRRLLEAFGYLDRFESNTPMWRITEKAFALLDKVPPMSIFISYNRTVSSAVAMMIDAELRTCGYNPFIDVGDILPGDEWHNLVEKRVRTCNVFIVILGRALVIRKDVQLPDYALTLNSPYVQEEIRWALEGPTKRIIPILHGGYALEALGKSSVPELADKNIIVIPDDTAQEFFKAMEQLKAIFGILD